MEKILKDEIEKRFDDVICLIEETDNDSIFYTIKNKEWNLYIETYSGIAIGVVFQNGIPYCLPDTLTIHEALDIFKKTILFKIL